MTDVVVGITSLPSRIGLIRPTIESLLAGVRKPDRIVVALPLRSQREQCGYDVPSWLADLGVRVTRPEIDAGPGTKLLGTLPDVPEDSILILADDDVRYRNDFVEKLAHAQSRDHGASFSFYTYSLHGLPVGQGCDGFSFWTPNLAGVQEFAQRHVLDTPLRLHDDLWISYFLASKGVAVKSLQHLLGGSLVYEQVHDLAALRHLEGDASRENLNDMGLRSLLGAVGLPPALAMRIRLSLMKARVVTSVKRIFGRN